MGAEAVGSGEPFTIGVTLPFNDHQAAYADLLRTARHIEQVGFDSVWIAILVDITGSRY